MGKINKKPKQMGALKMTKQILTIAITCDKKDCPEDMPESCLHCKHFGKKNTTVDIIEVLDDYRHKDELPPPEDEDESK